MTDAKAARKRLYDYLAGRSDRLSDADLLAAYRELPDGDQGPTAAALLAEIQRRNLDL